MIHIQTINRYWDPGKFLASKNRAIYYRFQEWCAHRFVEFVKLSIDRQRYKAKWRDLTPGYLAYKRKHGLSTNIWEASGQIKRDLKVLYSSNRKKMTIGFDVRVKHKRAKNLRVHQLAKILEYGTLRIPPRPLFRLAFNYFRNNTTYLYQLFLKEEGLA